MANRSEMTLWYAKLHFSLDDNALVDGSVQFSFLFKSEIVEIFEFLGRIWISTESTFMCGFYFDRFVLTIAHMVATSV